jgi:hypothetical protein
MISEEDAIEIARGVAVEKGWRWREPVRARRTRSWIFIGRAEWEVRTNADMRGTNVRVVVDAQDGTVLQAAYLPR